jgi:hypothetical protein
MLRNQWGAKNSNYKDGMSRGTINRASKRALRSVGRDLYLCENCGRRGKIKFPRHHVDRNRANNSPDNLLVLCQSCHNVEHMKERQRDSLGRLLPRVL